MKHADAMAGEQTFSNVQIRNQQSLERHTSGFPEGRVLFRNSVKILQKLGPETANAVARWTLKKGLVQNFVNTTTYPTLATKVWGLNFVSPVGIAAGFDKSATTLRHGKGIGEGFFEIGGVTPRPQQGNPSPRLIRLFEDSAVINRMGFNNDGGDIVASRIRSYKRDKRIVGVNLAANSNSINPLDDFLHLTNIFSGLCDYITLDISCPNTENGQVFLNPLPLRELISEVKNITARSHSQNSERAKVVAKLSPDINEKILLSLLDVMKEEKVDGITIGNTTTKRPECLKSPHKSFKGGLSGPPLFGMSTAMLKRVYSYTNGKIPLVGVGGISSANDAYIKIRAGASLVQLYTALIFQGPALIGKINEELAALLARDGFASVAEAVGADHR